MDVSLFLVCVKSVVRTAALHRMPPAGIRVFEVILPFGNIGALESLLFNLSVQVYLSKQISLLCCEDAVGSLLGLRSNPPLSRMPSADFRVFEVALFFVILIHFSRRSRIPLLYPYYTLRIILN